MGIFSQGLKRTSNAPMDDADILAMAVLAGLTAVVADGIKNGVDVNRIGKARVPALNLAIVTDKMEIAELLLESSADPNVPDPEQLLTPLHLAVTKTNLDLVQKLVAAKANPNARAKGDMTPISIAIRKNRLDIVQLLLAAGADPNSTVEPPDAPDDQRGVTGLVYAASNGDLALLDLLLNAGADVNLPKADGLTPLVCAVFNGELETVKRLMAAGAKSSPVGDADPLQLAKKLGHTQIAELLARGS